MTNQITLQKLAEQTGLSKSTISRAINYCGGVDAETALAIRRMAIEQGYTTPADGRGAPFCGVVLPEKPGYYWYPAQKNLYDTLRAGGISFRAALYPRLTDEEAFVSALEAMAALSPRVLVVSAPSHSAAGQRLRSVAARIPVFLLSELIQGANLFYFGSDAQRDGAALAGAFVAAYPDRHRFLIVDTEQNLSLIHI